MNAPLQRNVLLLEHDVSLRRLLTVQLQLLHYEVVNLASVMDALRARLSAKTALAVLDLEDFTPGSDEAIHRLASICPVIVLANSNTAEAALKAGAADTLLKPVSPLQLAAAVNRAIEDRARRTSSSSYAENTAMHAKGMTHERPDAHGSTSFTLSFDYVPTMAQLKASYIDRMLAAHGNNREAAARAMGISARNLYRHLAGKRASRMTVNSVSSSNQDLA